MNTPQLTSRADTFLRIGYRVLAAIEARPEVREMAAPMKAACDRLEAARKGREDADATKVARLKLRRQAGAGLDAAVRQVFLDLLAQAGGDRNREPFATVFPDGLTPLLDAVAARRIPRVIGLEERLKSLEGQAVRAEAIAKARQEFEAASRDEACAGGTRGNARALLDAARQAFVAEMHRTRSRLLIHYGDPRVADAFFPAARDRAGHEDTSRAPTAGAGTQDAEIPVVVRTAPSAA